MKKKIISALLCVAMCATFVGCSSKEGNTEKTEGSKSEEKVLTVATDGGFYPVIYTDDNGNLTGFEYDILEEVGKRSGYKTKYEIVGDMSVMFEGIESGKYDTMAGQVSITDEREQKYTFSDVYGYNAIKMAVRGDDPAKSVEDLQGRKVCIAFGTVLEDVFNKLNATYPEDKQIELVETEGNIYDELKVGHYDAFPITVLSFDKINEKGDYDFKLIGDPVLVDKNGFPFAKNPDKEKLEAVNKAIKEMKEDGTLSKLSEKYFGRDITKEEITE